ncbi:hypothetical protein LARV_01535 [Longilinea arvoryzae]|uniref:Glycosyltransferase n=1 Tax=Longilinea arvoryzae TaxID=360412 RepID=A0A0S7BFM1_9CHLR|nr:hypothetical protein [Longilinea arvoryzae]GAP13780.1 hypothetical protein LARV_01535 [Longilinea arvoryzae]
MTALITLFSAPKPFTNPHIATIQRNAIRSWLALGDAVEVLLLGNEDGLPEAADELGVHLIKEVKRNAQGTPLVSSLFELARRHSSTSLLAYVNADILLLPDFVAAAQTLLADGNPFLGVGQRWDLEIKDELDFGENWDAGLRQRIQEKGVLHPPAGSDYFLYPRDCFTWMPEFAIGRAGWDNWMIYWARREGWRVVDATADLPIVHQNHDYSHLPGGQPHYRLPETDVNVRLGGGRRTIFTLSDANYRLKDGLVSAVPAHGARFWREVEIYPLVRLHSRLLGQLFFALFHPRKAWGEARGWLAYKLGRLRKRH